MVKDFTIFLWCLKLGALLNLCFLIDTLGIDPSRVDPQIVIPAQIFFVVSIYRCLFPVGYKDNVVFHQSPLSSIFITRVLATFSEVAYIYQFSHVIRLLNVQQVGWIDALSWLMVVEVSVSQGFVWGAILTGKVRLFYYEEVGWAVIFVANTIASAYLYATVDTLGSEMIFLDLNLLFGLVYLPWQFIHLRVLSADAEKRKDRAESTASVTWETVTDGLKRSIYVKNQTVSAEAWGGFVGITWMVSYWATLIPMWLYSIVEVFAG